jgi:hypothetical protein
MPPVQKLSLGQLLHTPFPGAYLPAWQSAQMLSLVPLQPPLRYLPFMHTVQSVHTVFLVREQAVLLYFPLSHVAQSAHCLF